LDVKIVDPCSYRCRSDIVADQAAQRDEAQHLVIVGGVGSRRA
jgi:hypothetical protein